MSAAEIINELPKLSELERRAVREKLLELAARNEDGESLSWPQQQTVGQGVVTCAEAAEILRRADALLDDEDRNEIAAGIEHARTTIVEIVRSLRRIFYFGFRISELGFPAVPGCVLCVLRG